MEKPKRPLTDYEKYLQGQIEARNDLIKEQNFEILQLKDRLSRYELHNIEIKPIIRQQSNRKE